MKDLFKTMLAESIIPAIRDLEKWDSVRFSWLEAMHSWLETGNHSESFDLRSEEPWKFPTSEFYYDDYFKLMNISMEIINLLWSSEGEFDSPQWQGEGRRPTRPLIWYESYQEQIVVLLEEIKSLLVEPKEYVAAPWPIEEQSHFVVNEWLNLSYKLDINPLPSLRSKFPDYNWQWCGSLFYKDGEKPIMTVEFSNNKYYIVVGKMI